MPERVELNSEGYDRICNEAVDMYERQMSLPGDDFVAGTPELEKDVEEEEVSEPASKRSAPSSFRINARHLFLTYPKCWLSPSEAKDLLMNYLKEKMSEWIIVQEKHQVKIVPILLFLKIISNIP